TEVFRRPELGRVDEQRDHQRGVLPAGSADQRQMPLVEGAHGGYQADGPWRLAARLAQLGHGADRPHAGAPSRAAASAVARSTITSNRASSCGAVARTASRCAATVSSSPRATGPVSARSGPSVAQLSTVV